MFNSFSAETFFTGQFLTSKDSPCTEGVNYLCPGHLNTYVVDLLSLM